MATFNLNVGYSSAMSFEAERVEQRGEYFWFFDATSEVVQIVETRIVHTIAREATTG